MEDFNKISFYHWYFKCTLYIVKYIHCVYLKRRVTIPLQAGHYWLKFHIPIMIGLDPQIKKRGYYDLLIKGGGSKKALFCITQFHAAAIDIL